MPEKARIFWAEDDLDFFETRKEFVEHTGHKVVSHASTLAEAVSTIPTLGNLIIDVAILDANMSQDEHNLDGRDGKWMAKEIRRLHPHIKIIGNGRGVVVGADMQSPKGDGAEKLATTVTII